MMLYVVAEGVTQTGGLDLAMNFMLGKANSTFWAQVSAGCVGMDLFIWGGELSGQVWKPGDDGRVALTQGMMPGSLGVWGVKTKPPTKHHVCHVVEGVGN
jgi:hypothetical protein